MKRFSGLFLLFAVFALAFVVACGGDDEEEDTTTAQPTTAAPTSAPAAATATPKSEPILQPTSTVKPPAAATAVAATAVPVATQPPPPSIFDEDRFGGEIIWVPQGSVGNMDSMTSGSAIGRGVQWHFIEVLLNWDSAGILQPDMLESWDVSGSTYTFVLRDGLKWHDGTTPLPEDVAASIERWKGTDKAFAPTVSDLWNSFETIDDTTFKINLTAPTGLLLTGLGYVGGVQANVMPKEVADAFPPGEIITEYTGTGPYKFISWDVGNQIILDRNEDYVSRTEDPNYRAGAKIAYADRLKMIEIPDQQTRVAAVLTGSVDYLDVISGDFYEQALDNADKVGVHIGRPGAQPDIMFNMRSNLVGASERGRLIRLAIQAAVNAEDIMKGYGDPQLWQLCNSMWFCDTVWGQAGVNDERYNMNDVERAKALLAEAGYDDEPIIILDPTDFPTIHPIAPVLEQQLEAAGINAQIMATDWATQIGFYQEAEVSNSWHMFTNWNSSNLYHPLVSQPLTVSDRATNYPPDVGYPTSEALLALKKQMAVAPDLDATLALAKQMADLWWDDPKSVNFGNFLQLRVFSKDLMGTDIRGAPVGSPILLNVWWDNASKRADDPR